jgi:hypothetical protein
MEMSTSKVLSVITMGVNGEVANFQYSITITAPSLEFDMSDGDISSITNQLPNSTVMKIQLSYNDLAGNIASIMSTAVIFGNLIHFFYFHTTSSYRSGEPYGLAFCEIESIVPAIGSFSSPSSGGKYGSVMNIAFDLTTIATMMSITYIPAGITISSIGRSYEQEEGEDGYARGANRHLMTAASTLSNSSSIWHVYVSSSQYGIGMKSINIVTNDLSSSTNIVEVNNNHGWSSLTSSSNGIVSLSSMTAYTVIVSYMNRVGTVASTSASGIVIDLTPPLEPSIIVPTSSNEGISLSITLDEPAARGSLQMLIRSYIVGDLDRIITFQQLFETSSVPHTTMLPANNLMSGLFVESCVGVNTLMADRTYLLSFSYSDLSGNMVWTSGVNFTYDRTPPLMPLLVSPNNNLLEPLFELSFIIYELAAPNSVYIAFKDASGIDTLNGNGLHNLTLTSSYQTAGQHTIILVPSFLSSSNGVITTNSMSVPLNDSLVNAATYGVTRFLSH